MSQISINNYPTSNLVPGVYLTVDASQANTATTPKRALLIGQQTTVSTIDGTGPLVTGTYTPGVPVLAGTVAQVAAKAGNGSILARMYTAYRALDPNGEVWLLPLDDDPDAVPNTITVTIGGTATQAGVLSAYIAGQLVTSPVSIGDTASVIAQNLLLSVNENVNLPVLATGVVTTSGISVATLTAINAGAASNDIDVRFNYLGSSGGEQIPSGVTVAVANALAGVQNPSAALSTALVNLSSQPYDYIGNPYNDTTCLNEVETLLNDVTGRWSLTEQIFGHSLFAYRGTVSQRATFFGARDDQHASGIGFYDSPSPIWEWAAALTAACAISVGQDPALPIKDMGLPVLAPPSASQDIFDERQTMLQDGCATFTVNASNQVILERVVTTYTKTPSSGAPDNSYQQAETMFTLMAVLRYYQIQLSTQFSRKKLVSDGSIISGGSNKVTSQTILQTALSIYRILANVKGWVQNPTQFAQQAEAQNAGNGNVFLFLPVMIANQLWVIAANVQFTKP
jgi:phage tail sheath gpL-like